jgi:hypothetical protein
MWMFGEAGMSNKSDVVKRLEERVRELRTLLDRLESGRLTTRKWVCGERWRHTTQLEIEQHKRDIAKYERVIAQVQAQQRAA